MYKVNKKVNNIEINHKKTDEASKKSSKNPEQFYLLFQISYIFYALFARMGWALMLAWVTFACATGYGGNLLQLLITFESSRMLII